MRSFRSLKLFVIPALAVPLVLSTLALGGPAWALTSKPRPVKCYGLTGPDGMGNWDLAGCSLPEMTGGNATMPAVSPTFPPSSVTITWGYQANRDLLPLTTTFTLSMTAMTGRKDRCTGGALEYMLSGALQGNANTSATAPGVKGHLKMFVCDSAGTVGDLSIGEFAKPLKF